MSGEWFFVYGTLKRGQCRETCWPAAPLQVQAGLVRGRLIDLGDYPALLPGDDWVRGEIWQIASQHVTHTLRVLDEIEEFYGAEPDGPRNHYDRRIVDVYRSVSDTKPIASAHSYWFADPTTDAVLVQRRADQEFVEWGPGETS